MIYWNNNKKWLFFMIEFLLLMYLGVFYSFASSSKEVSLKIDEAISSWRALQNKVFH